MKNRVTVVSSIMDIHRTNISGPRLVYELYSEVSKYVDVDVIAFTGQHVKEKRLLAPGFTEYLIPLSKEHRAEQNNIDKNVNSHAFFDIGLANNAEKTELFTDTISCLSKDSAGVIMCRPFVYNAVKNNVKSQIKIFHQSQNVELDYEKSLMIGENPFYNELLRVVEQVEKEACNECALTFPCTHEDMQRMNIIYNTPYEKMRIIENGVDIVAHQFETVTARRLLKSKYRLNNKIGVFIGSKHQPNIEAVDYILNIAPRCPDVVFVIMGNLCAYFKDRLLPINVIFLGIVSEKTKQFIFSVADFAFNPMFSGSGSNVKMLEYMACGLPIVSTTFGTRGVANKSGFYIADNEEEMINTIRKFKFEQQKSRVRVLRKIAEEEFDWKKLAIKILDYMEIDR